MENIGISDLTNIVIADVAVYEENQTTIFEKMKEKGIIELYYTHSIKNRAISTIILHYQISDNRLIKKIIKSNLSFLNEIPIYEELLKRCGVKVQSQSIGHIIYRTNSSWRDVSSKKFASLPNDFQHYIKNEYPSESDDRQVNRELDQLNIQDTSRNDFNSLCQSIQSQLQKSFYNDVKTHVYICQLDKSGKKIREDYLKSNYKPRVSILNLISIAS